ncbi:MAG: ATP-dependent helicase RecG [Actinomycetota bacterium]|nr:ATP-dependent helicase RecG [Actinomycetota bacterium]
MVDFDSDLRPLLGDRTVKALAAAFDIRTVEEALRHYPRRYFQRGQLTDFGGLSVGEDVTVLAEIRRVSSRKGSARGRKPVHLTEVTIGDSTGRGTLLATFFNQIWREQELKVGARGLFAGKVNSFRGTLQLVHPDYTLLPRTLIDADEVTEFVSELIPVYPATSKMPSWRVAAAIELVLAAVDDLPDPLSPDIRREFGLVDFAEAMRGIHAPRDQGQVAAAQHRLRWEEAFVLQAELMRRRAARRATSAVPRTPTSAGLVAALDRHLPFELTAGQVAVSEEIATDMARTHPMLRLLQGDVGSGKTVVALRSMLATVDAGAQAALLAPTEVLAAQHYATVLDLLGPLARRGQIMGDDRGTAVVLLTGSMGARDRRQALVQVASGEAGIVIGTHALMSHTVDFADLGLVVVDEQHRFGVEQRAALQAKADGDSHPHTLVMTATPIPRTIAMTVFGDLDVSTLIERPASRSATMTHVVPAVARPDFLARAWQRCREEVGAGHQVYIVCPRITEEDPSGQTSPPGYPPTAVVDLVEYLQAGPLTGLRIATMHGKLTPAEKEAAMRAFALGPQDPDGVDVLVSTTVIEVGVDVPGATVMIIIDADRFGVSSLHQLRGRVGRGSAGGLCLLVTSASPGSAAEKRLRAVAATDDGFELSEIDLRNRREGDVLGASQSGRVNSLRFLSVLDDGDLIEHARAAAEALLEADPELLDHPELAAALDRLAASEAGDYLEKT